MQFQLNLELVLDIDRIGLGILVRTHVFLSRKQHRLHAAFLQIVVHHGGGNQLALSQHHFLLKQSEEVFGIRTDIVKM